MLLLAEVAVALSGYRLNEERALVSLKDRQERLAEIRRTTSIASDGTSVERLIQWVLSDPAGRSESPFSRMQAKWDGSAAAVPAVRESKEARVPTSKRLHMKMLNDILRSVAKEK
jgi:hypothetical protein